MLHAKINMCHLRII